TVHLGRGIQRPGAAVVPRLVRRDELLRAGEQLVGLVPDVGPVLRVGRGDLLLGRAGHAALPVGPAHREGAADSLAHHAWLAGRDVLAGGHVDDEVPREARSDVL